MSRRRADTAAAAVLAVDKPVGPTSHDIVLRARRALGTRRAGHTGTLDPFASGLLLICAGGATRLAEYFHLLPKRYEAVLALGSETTTDDRTGEVVREDGGWRSLAEEDVRAALRARLGRQRQRPPAFSAVRVGGRRRAHELARAGEAVALPERPVEVYALELREFAPPRVGVSALVSTGTYVRALVRDVGRALGCGAHAAELRRTAIGPFRVEDAIPAERLEPGAALPAGAQREPAAALDWLPWRPLDAGEAARVRSGGDVSADGVLPPRRPGLAAGALPEAPVRLLREGRLVAVAVRAGDRLRPRKVVG